MALVKDHGAEIVEMLCDRLIDEEEWSSTLSYD
jgi:hypothetical protein